MAFFKLNISKINDNVERYITYSNKIKEQSELVYNSLINADAYWSDLNTIYFISRIKQDGYKLDDYLAYFKSIYMEVLYFSDAIKTTCGKYGYKTVKSIKFDDTRLSLCLGYINQAIEVVNINLSRLKTVKQGVQYVSISSVTKKITDLNNLLTKLTDLKNEINSFCIAINGCVTNSRNRKSKIEKQELGLTLAKYGWQVTTMNDSTNTVSLNTTASVVSHNRIDIDDNSYKMSAINVYNPTVNKLDASAKQSNGINNVFSNSSALKKTEINNKYANESLKKQYSEYNVSNNFDNTFAGTVRDNKIDTPNSYVQNHNNVNTFDSKTTQYANLEQDAYTNVKQNHINVSAKHSTPFIDNVDTYTNYGNKGININYEKANLNVGNIPYLNTNNTNKNSDNK